MLRDYDWNMEPIVQVSFEIINIARDRVTEPESEIPLFRGSHWCGAWLRSEDAVE